jgi:ornithine cyclodeaminase/alanine dehydrogenase
LANPVFVSAEATEAVLSWPAMVDALRSVYSIPHTEATSPRRAVARGPDTWFRALAAAMPSGSMMGAKLFGLGRAKKVNYLISLHDQESGAIVALVDAKHITAFRTGATSAVAVDRLAPQKPVRLGILGSGLEARSHLAAIAAVREIAGFSAFSPNPAKREAYVAEMNDALGLAGTAVGSAEAAVADCDIVVGTTQSMGRGPTLLGAWLREGTLVVTIGATLPEHVECDTPALARADLIVADVPEEVLEETGDCLAAHHDGVDLAAKTVSLNDLMLGRADDRVRAARLPMYKSVGAGIQDIAVAELAFRAALERGVATELPIAFAMR